MEKDLSGKLCIIVKGDVELFNRIFAPSMGVVVTVNEVCKSMSDFTRARVWHIAPEVQTIFGPAIHAPSAVLRPIDPPQEEINKAELKKTLDRLAAGADQLVKES